MKAFLQRGLLPGVLALALTSASWAVDPIDTSAFVSGVTAEKMQRHLRRLQEIADKADGTRAAGTKGYNDSVRYVAAQLINSGYSVQLEQFPFTLFTENSPPELVRTSPGFTVYEPGEDFITLEYSGSGNVTSRLELARGIVLPPGPNPSSSDSGCSPNDFPNSVVGRIVLIQRGTCTFFDKARNAADAGAAGALIFNEGQPGRTEVLNGNLGEPVPIPVVGTTFELGNNLYQRIQDGQNVQLRLKTDTTSTDNQSINVIANTGGGRDEVVVVGAHLDSVPEGPGINDNGSGTAAILVIAEEMARQGIKPRNKVRFAFWGAEESGVDGSTHYVATLTPDQLSRIALNLNFDMMGSPNYVRFVYDGSGDIGPVGPPGSDEIEQVFVDYLADQGLRSEPTAFDGRSDYQAFILAGIPAGGLFSGAEGVKSRRQERIFGGAAGRPYDPCYHEACDDIDNPRNKPLNQLGKAAAHTVLTFAQNSEPLGARGAARAAGATAAAELDYRGPRLVR